MHSWSIISSESEYKKALGRLEELSENLPAVKSDSGKELLLLGYLIQRYEDENFKIEYPDPIAAIKVRMEQLGLSVSDLLDVFGDRGTASKVLNGQRSLSVSMVRNLSEKLSLPAELLLKPFSKAKSKVKTMSLAEPAPRYKKSSKK